VKADEGGAGASRRLIDALHVARLDRQRIEMPQGLRTEKGEVGLGE